MKNLNLIKRLWTDSHEKQSPQRFGRYAAMLIMLLTIGVGQMWADTEVTGASIKYDVNASTSQWWNVSGTAKQLGQVYTFKLKGFWAQLNGGDVCQNTCMYYGFTSACSLGNYNIKDPNNWSDWPRHFQTESMNVNILSGLTPNKYTLYAKFIGHGKSGCANVESSTYQMKFEYPAYLSGDGTWCGTEWNATADAQKMTYNAGGYYSKTVSSVTKADHKLKVATYNWASSWGHAKYDATNSSNVYSESNASGNIQFQPAMAGDVTIKFKISDQTISIICAAPTITLDDEGGSGGDGSLNTYYGEAPASVSVPERDGYSFAGYWTGDDGTGTQVIGANGAWLRNVSNYTNNDATWKWIVRANSTLHAKWTQDPTLTMNSVSPTTLVEGNTVTINVTRANSSAEISYEYKIGSGSWTSLAPASTSNSGQTATWAIPESHGATRTFYFRAKMTDGSLITTDVSDAVTVYGKKTIKVRDTNGWGDNFKIHRWGGDAGSTTWPGETTNITSAGGQWKQVVLYSSSTDFLFDKSSDPDHNKTANKTYASMEDGNCYEIQSGTGGSLTLTSTDCPGAPSVTTVAATSVGTTSVQFNASSVSANNDAITDYGFKWGTTDACSSGTVPASNLGAGTTFSATKSSLTNGTTYYFKAYATNGQGTTYGSAVSVRTKYITTVTLDQEGGSDGTEEVTATEGSAMPSGATAPGKSGYTFGGYYASAGGSGKKYYNANMTSANNWDVAASTATIHAKWTPITYTIHFNGNGNTSGSMTDQTGVTYDAATTITANAFGKTGYNFGGWATTEERANAGTVDRADGAAHGNLASTQGATAQLWAVWTGKQCTLTLDQQTSATGYGSSGTVSVGSKATYDAAMPSLTGTMPTAAQGYAFMGFYSGVGGSGTQYYDGSGNSVHKWDVNTESTTILYAYYKKAEITALTFDAGTVEPEATVGVTPTISPTPTGTTIICWTILHSNDTPLDPQPAKTWSDGKLTFAASTYSGTYKVQAVLRTGNDCGGGTALDTETTSFLVAGSHSVTVNYKCSSDVIKAATSVIGRPTEWSDDITAPDIFGYTFSSWSSADGVTIKDSENEDVTSSSDATIKIKATYAGSLTANYTQKQLIYFKNTLGWSNVYVNFYSSSYWNNPKGSGNQSVTKRNLAMTQYGETDIWYYDYGAASISPSLYVSFTSDSQDNTQYFWKSGGVNVVYPANYPDAINTDKSSENGFKAATPMFVPLATQDKVTLNQSSGGKADYYNAGYWTKYTSGTGYTLEIYNSAGNSLVKSAEFTSADELMPMKATVDLEGGTTYKFQLKRSGDIYYGNSGTMTYANHGDPTPWDMTNGSFSMCGITTNAAGDYTFNLSYSGNSSTPPHYRLRIAVDYPVADGDYRLIYKDAVHTNWHPSAIVSKANDRKDTVSFFVRPGSSPEMKIQTATVNPSTGAVSWGSDVSISSSTLTGLASTDVYNFNLSMDGSGNISLESVDTYTGNFYIRTDAANSKWDNYRTDPDHLMVYSEYSIDHGGYTHYHAHWVNKDDAGRKNVKFTIANDYSPCISDTLTRETASGTWANIASFITEGGDLLRSANVRFMWDKRDNSISRAYVDGAQEDGSEFLTIQSSDSKIKNAAGDATLTQVTFSDNGNWMYEANIKAQPTAQIKLLSKWGESNIITQYFRGASDKTETLIGGSGSNWYDIRLIYDFKTNRLIAGLIPSGTIDDQMAIHADVMFVREHHGDIAQLTFAEKDSKMGAITDIETAFGVLQFSKWTINNKSKADGHAPLSPLLSQYERDLFYVSFPFKVAMEEVFGFGTYGQHWIIEEYDGASRAVNGYWAESGPNWKFVWNRKDKFFEPGQGYIIALELDEMGESSDIWANTDRVELYFPSYGTMDNITSSTATYNIPAHECTINRSNESNGHGGTLGPDYDRRVKDSHWNVLGVPTYINPDAPNFANTAWTTTATETSIGPNFLYEWNMTDNSVSAVSASGYTYHAMHAYLVQYCGDVTWTSSVSVTPPAGIAARRMSAERPQSVEFRLEMLQNDVMVDQTYIKLSDDEHVTTGFEFNYDLSKEFNKSKANIYTLIGTEPAAGNVLPLTEQATVVPVGVKIATTGDYTFSIPDGTEGIGITLIDNETGIRTSLSALDYTINLSAGEYTNRFFLEISPIKPVATGIEQSQMTNHQSPIKKVLVDGLLYIVKDGKMFDAQGRQVK